MYRKCNDNDLQEILSQAIEQMLLESPPGTVCRRSESCGTIPQNWDLKIPITYLENERLYHHASWQQRT